MSPKSLMLSPIALLRFRRVSIFRAHAEAGMSVDAAVCLAAAVPIEGKTVAPRTLYRWIKAEQEGAQALNNTPRPLLKGSKVLSDEVLSFIVNQKDKDPAASIPELIDRARHNGLLHPSANVSRSTVWRTLGRLGVDTRRKGAVGKDTRRFAFSERLQLVMADFKAFRVGPAGHKRLALYFLDDATRYALHVSVHTGGERAEYVLAGLHAVLKRFGRFSLLYVDNGPGFKADLVTQTLARLNPPIPVILGTAGYPEGRGKIERFNRSLKQRTLRHLRKPGIDPDTIALELRLRHDLFEYNRRPHQGLQNESPHQRWEASKRELRPVGDDVEFESVFTEPVVRKVSKDHLISIDAIQYELPMGYAGTQVTLHRRILTPGRPVFIEHRGELLRLHPVDLAANAKARRAKPNAQTEPCEGAPAVTSAAESSFNAALRPLVDEHGGCAKGVSDEE